jgi:hypothetical protein
MTTPSSNERFTSSTTTAKIVSFLKGGGVAKLGKAVSQHDIVFGDLDKTEGETVVVVPLHGVCQHNWRAATLDTLRAHVDVKVNGTEVSIA